MSDRPIGAFILSLLGGVLILAEGAILAALSSAVGSAGCVGCSEAGQVIGGVGAFGVLMGILVVILSVILLARPENHLGLGIAILVFSLLSFFGGAGFVLGLILGVVGGILAIVFVPEDDETPLPGDPGWIPARAPDWPCPKCGAWVSGFSTVCTRCGTARPAPTTAQAVGP